MLVLREPEVSREGSVQMLSGALLKAVWNVQMYDLISGGCKHYNKYHLFANQCLWVEQEGQPPEWLWSSARWHCTVCDQVLKLLCPGRRLEISPLVSSYQHSDTDLPRTFEDGLILLLLVWFQRCCFIIFWKRLEYFPNTDQADLVNIVYFHCSFLWEEMLNDSWKGKPTGVYRSFLVLQKFSRNQTFCLTFGLLVLNCLD